MGYKDFDGLNGANEGNQADIITLDGNSMSVELPDASFVKDSEISRDGMDLVLDGPQGSIIIEGYFAQLETPTLTSPEGQSLTPNLVESFVKNNPLYADAGSMTDESPIGAVKELTGEATVTRVDGSTDTLKIGSAIHQGDIIETSDTGAVNIVFVDETSFAISEDARLAIDEYVFDPSNTESVTNFSVLKGMFVFTSGLIGREDPDDVNIETPVGSIGIRGTTIAGDADTGEITLIDGAIVLRDPAGNEITLDSQFETGKFDPAGGQIQNMGQKTAAEVAGRFASISNVSPNLFSSINDVANGDSQNNDPAENRNNENSLDDENSSDDQSLDGNDDGQVDGTVDENGDGSADGTLQGGSDNQDGENQQGGERGEGETGEAIEPTREQVREVAKNAAQEAIESGESPTEAIEQAIIDTFGENILDKRAARLATKQANQTDNEDKSTLDLRAGDEKADSNLGSSNTQQDNTQDSVSASNDLAPPTTGVNGTTETFRLDIQRFPLAENFTSGGLLARIRGVDGEISNLTFAGGVTATDLGLELLEISPNVWEISQLPGEPFDFEENQHFYADLQATSTDGNTTTRTFNPLITNENEAPEFLDQASLDFFSATTGTGISYNFRQEFFDEDFGDNLDYRIIIRDNTSTVIYDQNFDGSVTTDTLGAPINLPSFSFDSNTGQFNIGFGSVGTDTFFRIEVEASDGSALPPTSTGEYYLDAFALAGDGTFSAGTGSVDGSDVISIPTVATSFTITGANNKVFFNNGNDDGINLIGTNSLIHLGNGNDEIDIIGGATFNDIVGGNGFDIFDIQDVDNFISGDEGNDVFELDLNLGTSIISDLETASAGALEINGGSDSLSNPFFINFNTNIFNGNGDKLRFLADNDVATPATGQGSTIDLTATTGIDAGIIRNMEILDFSNGDDNHVILDVDAVFSMTDQKETLVIRGDVLDSLDFDTDGEDWFMGDQITDSVTGDTYDTYFVDGVTLLVDTDVATTVT